GFISTSNFGDVFFHIKDFQKGEQPIPGREVYFEVVKKENKNRAIHVYYSDHEQTQDKQKPLPIYLWIIFISIAIGVAYPGSIQLK
ncbi:cold shock domain-containing protein, partial [Acinetobacter baumannii]